MISPSFGNKYS